MYRRQKILVVEDGVQVIEMVKKAIEARPYELITASSKKTCLEKAKTESPDLVIVGCLEPRGEACECHVDLRNDPGTSTIPLMVVDACPEERETKGWRKEEGLRLEADDYVVPPIETPEMLTRIEVLLARAPRKIVKPDEVLDRLEALLQYVKKIEGMINVQDVKAQAKAQ